MSSARRTFSILDAVVGAGNDGLSFAGIVRQTEIPKASAHRLLAELVDLSALVYDSSSRRYRGGLMLAHLGARVLADFDLRTAVRPFLEQLHATTGHVATLGIRNDDTGVYVDKMEASDFGIRLHSEIGKEFPLHCTAIGKVLLAYADKSEIRRLTNRKLQRYTANTITDGKALRAELAQVARSGYAIDDEEITRGLICVAAAVFTADGLIAGAMSCTFPSYIKTDRGIDTEISTVCDLARRASGQSARKSGSV